MQIIKSDYIMSAKNENTCERTEEEKFKQFEDELRLCELERLCLEDWRRSSLRWQFQRMQEFWEKYDVKRGLSKSK